MPSVDTLPVWLPPGTLAVWALPVSSPEPDGKVIVAIQGPLGEPEGKEIVVTTKGCPVSDGMLIVVAHGPWATKEEKLSVVINGRKLPDPELAGVVAQETPPAPGGVAPSPVLLADQVPSAAVVVVAREAAVGAPGPLVRDVVPGALLISEVWVAADGLPPPPLVVHDTPLVVKEDEPCSGVEMDEP